MNLIPRFTALKVLHLNNCGIEAIPEGFAALTRLETFSLCGNDLKVLPDAVAALPALRSLVVSKNPGTRQIKATLKKRGVPYAVT